MQGEEPSAGEGQLDLLAGRLDIVELYGQLLVPDFGVVEGPFQITAIEYAGQHDGEAVYVASIEGRKIRMMRRSPDVCFETDEHGDAGWRSVIAQRRAAAS